MSKPDDQRAKRLAEALRENLRRRKAQARGAAGAASEDGLDPEAAGKPADRPDRRNPTAASEPAD